MEVPQIKRMGKSRALIWVRYSGRRLVANGIGSSNRFTLHTHHSGATGMSLVVCKHAHHHRAFIAAANRIQRGDKLASYIDEPSMQYLPLSAVAAALLTVLAVLPGGPVTGLSTAAASELRLTAVVRAVRDARASVVNISGRKTVRADFDRTQQGARFEQVNGMGTGVVIDQRGYIVTNYHVIEGVRRIQVTMYDKSQYVASIVAHDTQTDLAVIKINTGKELPVINSGTSADLMHGETVIAVGNAFGYRHTVTKGIVSALHRSVQVSDDQMYHDLIQTDASINPGNSGGPLLNIDGEMIGINVAVRVGAQGIGFAIPVNEALDVAARLMKADTSSTVSNGVSGSTVADRRSLEFAVRAVTAGSPAAVAGLKAGDVVTAVGDQPVQRPLDFERALLGTRAGQQVRLTVKRQEQSLAIAFVADQTTPVATTEDRSWDTLGLKLEQVPSHNFRSVSTRYRGGLRVADVKQNSPAWKQGIRRGDVLVGMHIWETVSLENVTYILDRPEFQKMQPIKFFIIRGKETLYGHMQVRVASK